MKKFDNELFKRHYLCIWVKHDDNSCNALKEYDSLADYVSSPYKFMQKVAKKYGTSINEMKKHRKCIKNRRNIQ